MKTKIKLKLKYKKPLSFLIALCLAAGLVPLMPITANANTSIFGGGSGSVSDPWLINNLVELQAFRDNVNSGNTYSNEHIKLNANISLKDIDNWIPIGNDTTRRFQGTFNGNGHIVSDMRISGAVSGQGFFGWINDNGIVSNLGMININMNVATTGAAFGGIAGRSSGIIQNCFVTGSIIGGFNVGGGDTPNSDVFVGWDTSIWHIPSGNLDSD